MIHRGPDGRHTARGNLISKPEYSNTGDANSGRGPKWVMGHQRLAIVDPDSHAADMPFVLNFGEERYRLAANGEIYNHNLLYEELVKEGWGYAKISKSDCETIAHACAHWGPEEAVKRLDGMFAFVLFKEGNEQGGVKPVAFAARDPVGIKPLYYANTEDGAVVFASELKALVGHVVAGSVRQLPPGHYWTPEGGEVRYHRPEWNFNVSSYQYEYALVVS
jgi:asparagine synthase (glutamine-hydrolysing)